MNEHMNPDYPKQRGCFLDEDKDSGACKITDYPTWNMKNGRWVVGANDAIADGSDYIKTFQNKHDAVEFCKVDNYVICAYPKSEEELAEIRAKREAWYAAHVNDIDQEEYSTDPFAELDI